MEFIASWLLLLLLLIFPFLLWPSTLAIKDPPYQIVLRQCRWAPHTARDENGLARTVSQLDSPEMGELFSYDEESDWSGYIDDPRNLRPTSVLPKWIFRKLEVQILIYSVLMVDSIILESQTPSSEFYISAWNVLKCGVFKMHYSTIQMYDEIIGQVLLEENKLDDLLDLIYRIGLCVSNGIAENCPTQCRADVAFVTSCSSPSMNAIEGSDNCFAKLPEELQYKPFRGKDLQEITWMDFVWELEDFREWHTSIPDAVRIPSQAFEENLLNHRATVFIMTEFLQHDPDEKPVTLDTNFNKLRANTPYIDNGCNLDQADRQQLPACFQVRAQLHTKLIRLQEQLASRRVCNCKMGYRWDPDFDQCRKQILNYCHEQDNCKNGGTCSAEVVSSKTLIDGYGDKKKSIVIKCACPPAWTGSMCELERDVCQTLPSNLTCGDHVCERNPAPGSRFGFHCVCPPETHKRTSAEDPRCLDINECTERSSGLNPICKNDGECENRDPGYVCNCKHEYSGPQCEFPPPPPSWSEWEEWSKCIQPEKAIACEEPPMQVRIRRCKAAGFSQHCEGLRRQIRFVCPAEINNWDTQDCSKFRRNVSETSRRVENYRVLDYTEHEEYGKFSSKEILLVLESQLTVYLGHYRLLTLAFLCCIVSPVAAGWCAWRMMREVSVSQQLAKTRVFKAIAKQQAFAAANSKVEAGAFRAMAAAQSEKLRNLRDAVKERINKVRTAVFPAKK